MFLKQFKKVFGFGPKGKESGPGKLTIWSGIISKKLESAILESQLIVNKMQDLHKTNYNLASKHLKDENFREAIFRFKIVRKFWPEDHKSHLKLIYCYFVVGQEEHADSAIDYLLSLDARYKSKIEKLRIDASFKVYPKKKSK